MPKNTFPVSGGAMPKIDRNALMRRVWAMFGETYKYPLIMFTDIGPWCFDRAVRQARAEGARLAAAARPVHLSPTPQRGLTCRNRLERVFDMDHTRRAAPV